MAARILALALLWCCCASMCACMAKTVGTEDDTQVADSSTMSDSSGADLEGSDLEDTAPAPDTVDTAPGDTAHSDTQTLRDTSTGIDTAEVEADAAGCEPGLDPCGDLSCVDLQTNPRHCGGCGQICSGNQDCVAGSCLCLDGFADCNDDKTDGCETDLATTCNACLSCTMGETCLDGACVRYLNIDGGPSPSAKAGLAATGIIDADFWNAVAQEGSVDYTVSDLLWSDTGSSPVSVRVVNLPGIWSWATAPTIGDPMYQTYIYSWTGAQATLTFAGLPPGQYRVYAYGHAEGQENSGYALSTHLSPSDPALMTTPAKYTTNGPGYNANAWMQGMQYVILGPVSLSGGHVLRLTVFNGSQGTGNSGCLLNGLQIEHTRGIAP